MFTGGTTASSEQLSSLEPTGALLEESPPEVTEWKLEQPVAVATKEARFTIKGKTVIGCAIIIGLSLAVYGAGVFLFQGVFQDEKALLCAAITTGATLFWSSGVIPLEVTSLVLLPVLVAAGVLSDQPGLANLQQSLTEIGRICLSKVSLLLLGSCLLSVYFQNSGGDKLVLPYLLGSGNRAVTLAKAMGLSLGLSSVMSNVTAPIIIVSVLQSSSTAPSPAMIMGVALAANVGGMLLPISSPQSVLGSSRMEISWLTWLTFSVPTVLVCLVLLYALLLFALPYSPAEDQPLTPEINSGTGDQKVYLAVVSVAAVVCWALAGAAPSFGAYFCAVPILALSCTRGASRVLNHRTLEILAIAISGTALGKGIETTKMLEDLISRTISYNQAHSVLLAVATSSLLMLVVSCLVCHTLSAVILLPILQKIGAVLHREKLILGVATLACSCGMALPTSGFPNILASSVTNREKQRVISTSMFILLGTLATLICWTVIISVSLFVMTWIEL